MEAGATQTMIGIAAQALFVTASFAAMVLFPPREGAIMLVPLDAESRATLVAAAVAGGASLLARGPLPASVVVQGERDRLSRALGDGHVLMVAAPRRWCGVRA
jgi:hypothetical protein